MGGRVVSFFPKTFNEPPNIMADQDPIPSNHDDFNRLLQNLAAKVPGYASTLGIAASAYATLATDAATFNNYLAGVENGDLWIAKQRENLMLLRSGPNGGASPAAFTGPTLPTTIASYATQGIEKRLRDLIALIKSSPGYTRAIGDDLGITTSPPAKRMQPKVSGKAQQGSIINLVVVLGGNRTFLLRSRRGAETALTTLGTFAESKYADNRPPLVAGVPEQRFYEAQYIKAGVLIGDPSDLLGIWTQP